MLQPEINLEQVGQYLGAGHGALVVQFMRMALASCVSWLKSMQKLDFAGNVKAVFGKDSLSIYIFGIIGATPANIIYSFIAAYFEKHNRKKVVRRSVKGA